MASRGEAYGLYCALLLATCTTTTAGILVPFISFEYSDLPRVGAFQVTLLVNIALAKTLLSGSSDGRERSLGIGLV